MDADQKYYHTAGHTIAAAAMLPVIDIAALILRLRARKKQKQRLGPDDWLILPATVRSLHHVHSKGKNWLGAIDTNRWDWSVSDLRGVSASDRLSHSDPLRFRRQPPRDED